MLQGSLTDGFIFIAIYAVAPHIYIKLEHPEWFCPPGLTVHRKAGVCLIIWSKISELKVEAGGKED